MITADEAALAVRVVIYKRHLLNILAVIHRDGGQYTGEHGIKKSVADAMKIVSDLVVR